MASSAVSCGNRAMAICMGRSGGRVTSPGFVESTSLVGCGSPISRQGRWRGAPRAGRRWRQPSRPPATGRRSAAEVERLVQRALAVASAGRAVARRHVVEREAAGVARRHEVGPPRVRRARRPLVGGGLRAVQEQLGRSPLAVAVGVHVPVEPGERVVVGHRRAVGGAREDVGHLGPLGVQASPDGQGVGVDVRRAPRSEPAVDHAGALLFGGRCLGGGLGVEEVAVGLLVHAGNHGDVRILRRPGAEPVPGDDGIDGERAGAEVDDRRCHRSLRSEHCWTCDTALAPSEWPAMPRWSPSKAAHSGFTQSTGSLPSSMFAFAAATSSADQPPGTYGSSGVEVKKRSASMVPSWKLNDCWKGTPASV